MGDKKTVGMVRLQAVNEAMARLHDAAKEKLTYGLPLSLANDLMAELEKAFQAGIECALDKLEGR